MTNSDIMVSVIIPVYNHENYVLHALNSVLMQKVDFKYEVLVGEDCSTDHSREIIQAFEREHPDFLRVYYRSENMNKSHAQYNNPTDLRMRSRGKYIITLEGDDYWTDENKLQKQVDFLESNPDYIAVSHNCQVVNKNEIPIDESYPECKDTEYTLAHFISGIMPGQLTTVMMRNYVIDKKICSDLLLKNLTPGDRLMYFMLVTQGRVFCMQSKMSAYRLVTKGGDNFTSRFKYNFAYFQNYYEQMINFATEINNHQAIVAANLLMVRNIFRGVKYDKVTLAEIVRVLGEISYKREVCQLLIKEAINVYIKKKEYAKDLIV